MASSWSVSESCAEYLKPAETTGSRDPVIMRHEYALSGDSRHCAKSVARACNRSRVGNWIVGAGVRITSKSLDGEHLQASHRFVI
jgi:hypothetical protein